MSLGGKNTVGVSAGDRLTILTPGGGGHGPPPPVTCGADRDRNNAEEKNDEENPDRKAIREAEMRLSGSVLGHRLGQEQA